MAARFWVGGTGIWDGITTVNWSATSGGASGASVPGSSDTVTFDANSLTSAQTCTVATDFSITSLSIGTMLGTLDFSVNNNSPTMQTFDGVGAGASGTFKMGTGTWTITGANQQVWNLQGSHLTTTTNTGTIIVSGVNASMSGGARVYNNVSFTGGGLMQTVRGDTYANLTVQSNGVVGSQHLISTNITVTGTYTVTGSHVATSRVLVRSGTIQFQIQITAAAVALTNADFVSIIFAGAATWSGTSIGNAGNNTGTVTYTTPVTRFWVGNGGNWGDTTHWSASSGGSSGASVPLCHDTVTFDANSFATNGQTVACNVYYLGKDISFAGTTAHPPTWNTSLNQVVIQGSLTLAAGMSMTGANTTVILTPWSPVDITTAGVTMTNSWSLEGGTAAVNLRDNFIGLVNRPFVIVGGTLTTNNFNMTVGNLSAGSSNQNAKTINAGTSTITTTTNSGIYFAFQGASMTLSGLSATFICSGGGGNLNLGSQSLGTVIFQSSGTATDSISGSGTISNLQFNSTGMTGGTHTTTFAAGTTVTLSSPLMSAVASSGATQTLKSSSNGTAWNLSVASGIISLDWISLQDSHAAGGATFYAGANSTNVSGNTGWLFSSAPFKGSMLTVF